MTRTDGGTLRVTGTRVSLASIVHCFWRGETPETMIQSYPSLTLEQAYGAIAYYLSHRQEVDQELKTLERSWDERRSVAQEQNTLLRHRILEARGRAAS